MNRSNPDEAPAPLPAAAVRRTVGQTLRAAAQRLPNQEAIVIGQRRLTNAQVLAHAESYAGALARHGVQPRDHVGVLMPNTLEYLLLFYGCALLGAHPVHFNSRYKLDDLRYVIVDSDIKVLFTSAKQREHADYAAMLREVFPALATWRFGTPLEIAAAPRLQSVYCFHADDSHGWGTERDFMARAAETPVSLHQVDPEDVGLIMYTSGTTAKPKACLLPHRALEGAGHALAERWRMSCADRFWDPLPFFHMSTMLPLAACRASGATFIAQEHFDAGAAVSEIVSERATILYPSFPTLTNALFAHPDFSAERFSAVRLVNNVGAPDLLRRYARLLPQATHVSAYGLTEAGGVIAFGELGDTPEQLIETSGRPFAGIEVKIVDPESLLDAPTGQRGEIWIRGPTTFLGYYKDVDKTRATMTPDGWLRSGDFGALDPTGHIRYLGRIKDMLKVGGENVAAIEIESYLCTHPNIKIAQVIGVPDERLTEVAAAFVELHDGTNLTAAEVLRFCQGRIAGFKIPRYVYFVTQWPISATKIQKYRLRELINAADRLDPSRLT